MLYEEIDLTKEEKRSLRSFRWRKKQSQNEIKCYYNLHMKHHFIDWNHTGEIIEETGEEATDGTFSLTEDYFRYLTSRRKWLFKQLPAWFALLVSFVSLAISIFSFLITIGMIIL